MFTEKLQVSMDQKSVFRIDSNAKNNELVRLYTKFPSYDILQGFFNPAVAKLKYWGGREKERTLHCQ